MRSPPEPTFCDHCGLPVGAAGHRRLVDGEPRAFCCLGCSIAWRLAGPAAREGGSEGSVFLAKIGLGVVLSAIVMLIQWVQYVDPEAAADPTFKEFSPLAQLLAATPVVLILGVPFLWNAAAALRGGRIGADLLIGLGILAGFVASCVTLFRGEADPLFFDTVTGLATLVVVGRWLEARAKERATAGLRSFLSGSTRPARRIRPSGSPEGDHVAASDLVPGDHVRVLAGERIPADGRVLQGRALVDEAALTGEPLPRAVGPGDEVRAPCLPLDGPLVVEVTRASEDSLLAQVGRVLARARAERAPAERLADRISAFFVPAVLLLALGVLMSDLHGGAGGADAAVHALSVLVVACPCALGIATPLAVAAALGRLAERGILVRSGSALSDLRRVRTVAFDKTGTLTEGRPEVGAVRAEPGFDEGRVLRLAASVEATSEHALGRGIAEAARKRGLAPWPVEDVRVHAGRGIEARVAEGSGSAHVRVGSGAWLGLETGRAQVAVLVDGRPAGTLELTDALRPSARPAVEALRRTGISVRILSGDTQEAAQALAVRLGLPPGAAVGGLLPDRKVEAVRALRREGRGAVAFVGDGLNDAPALAAADLGLAVGSGTDLARESAAVSLLGDDLTRIPGLLRAAAVTRRAVAWNLFWAFVYNAVAVGFAVLHGIAPVVGALAMVVSSLFVIANSARLRATLPTTLGSVSVP